MFAECYDLSLQCDGIHILPLVRQYAARSKSEAWKQARTDGWTVNAAAFECYCKRCSVDRRISKRKKELTKGNV